MARMDEPDLIYGQSGHLILVFDVEIHRKYGLLKPEIASIDVGRASPPSLKDIVGYLESRLQMNGHGGQLLLKAVCAKMRGRSRHLQNTSPSAEPKRSRKPSSQWRLTGVVPLVCQQIWSNIIVGYPEATLTILVNQHSPQVSNSCISRLFKRELKYLDIVSFLPTKSLKTKHIMSLCRDIFEGGVKVKPELRRGVWLHLVGVFHPQLEGREGRERYMAKLRMVYDHLKGKIMGESSDLLAKEQLVDAVHRDAIRTDPGNPFFADCRRQEESYISQHYHPTSEESNIQKLINIIVIYTLEHGTISYTQGMTDILSPILYVMRNEADAYICFSAMVERIQQHFSTWCTGTLLKLERLRHLCEVLDPKLYSCLSSGIEEDAFALFFGMVLIECRREFSFDDSFHLLETIWAGVACIKNTMPTSSDLSNAQWANYMTYESSEVLQQVFEESGLPYSAVPLPHTISGSYSIGYPIGYYSRNPSLIMSQSPPNTATFLRQQNEIEPCTIPEHPDSSASSTPLSINHSNSSIDMQQQHRSVVIDGIEEEEVLRECHQPRFRSLSDSNLKVLSMQSSLGSIRSPCHVSSDSPQTLRGGVNGASLSHKLGNSSFSHSESELYDSFSNSKVVMQTKLNRHHTEMSDMSSMSSGTASVNGMKSTDMPRNGTPDSATGISRVHSGQARSSASMERPSNPSVDSGGSDMVSSSQGSSKFKDALPYLPAMGVAELPNDILLEPESNSLGGGGSPDTLVAIKSPRMTAVDSTSTPISSRTARGEGGVAKHKAFTDPKTGANYVTTCAEVHVDNRAVSEQSSALDIEQVIEHNGGMITSMGRRSPLVPRHTSREEAAIRFKSPPRESVSDGEVAHRRKLANSPKRVFRTCTPTDHSNASSPMQHDTEVLSSHRVTPVAFFDAIERIAESAPTRGAHFPASLIRSRGDEKEPVERKLSRGREEGDAYCQNNHNQTDDSDADAEISNLLFQLVSTEEGAPRVDKLDSLTIPFSDCYSLFICLSILVQKRHEIINSNADFYQLSTILNSHAAKQDLEKTLRVAHQLYRVYRKYQEMCLGPNGNYDTWLDDPEMKKL